MKHLLHQKNKFTLLVKRFLFQEAPKGQPAAAPAVVAETPERTAEAPRQKTFEEMNVLELEQALAREQNKTQEVADKLLAKLGADNSLLEFYRRQVPATPTAPTTPPASETTTTPRAPQSGQNQPTALDQAVTSVSTFFQESLSAISPTVESPEQKAMEHKKRIVARIEQLVRERKISVSPDVITSVRRDIESQASALVNRAPRWTEKNAYAVAAIGAVFLFNWWRKEGSLWGAAKSTVLQVGGLGLATYALKTGLQGTKVGDIAETVWNKTFIHMPFLSQRLQRQAQEGQAPLRDVQVEQATKILRLKSLLRSARRGNLEVRETGDVFRTREDMIGEIRHVVGVLRESSMPRVKALMQDINISTNPTAEELEAILRRVEQCELEEAFQGKVPQELLSVMTLKNQLLDRVDRRTNDIPREINGLPKSDFREAVDRQTTKSIEKVQQIKDRKNAFLRKMGLAVVSFARTQQQTHDQVDQTQRQMALMQQQGQTVPDALRQNVLQLSSTLNNAEQMASEFQAATQNGNADQMFDELIHKLQEGKDDLYNINKPGKFEQMDVLCDRWMMIETVLNASSQIPEANLMSQDLMQVASQGIVALGATAPLVMVLGIGGSIGAISGTFRVATTPLRLMSYFGRSASAEVFADAREVINQNTRLRAYGPTVLVAGAAFALSYLSFRRAYQTYNNFVINGVEGTSRGIRLGQSAVEVFAGAAEFGVGYNAARRIGDVWNFRNKGAISANYRGAAGNLLALGLIEGTRFVASNLLDQLATSQDIENIHLDRLTETELFGLMTLYQDTLSREAFQWLRTHVESLAGKADPSENQCERMRMLILREFGRRSNLSAGDIDENFLPYYQKYGDRKYNFDQSVHNEILTYALLYAQVAKATSNNRPTEGGFDKSLAENHAVMKQRLDMYRLRMESEVLRGQLAVMDSANTMAYDPEIRFLFQSFGSNYPEIMEFYQLCKAAERGTNDPQQKAKLSEYIRFADFYITNYFGYRGPVSQSENQRLTYQGVLDFIEKRKNIDPPEENQLVQYYADAFMRTLFTTERTTLSDAEKPLLMEHLQQRGVREEKARAFADEFFRWQYQKGTTDGLLHRTRSETRQVFLAGLWREAREGNRTDSRWIKDPVKNYLYTRVVDGLKYHFLQPFNCFVTEPPTAPPNTEAGFHGNYENGVYHDPQCNINDINTLTPVDVPSAVYQGLLDTLRSSN